MKLRSRIVSLVAVLTLACSPLVQNNLALAKETASSKPNITYGTANTVVNWDNSKIQGPYPGGWNQIKDASKYSNWDRDEFACYSSSANRVLSTSNTSKVEVSVGAKESFIDMIELTQNVTIGQEFTKTAKVTYDAQKGYNYILWSANVIDIKTYIFNSDRSIQNVAYLNGGQKSWFFREKL